MRASALLLLLGCTSRELVVIPEPPIDSETRSLIIVFEGDTSFVHAVDLASRSQPLLQIEAPEWNDGDFSAVAFSFDRPLADYGLTAGLLPPLNGPRSCALKTPRAAARYRSDDAVWRDVDPDDDALVRVINEPMFGCTPLDLCRTFQADIIALPSVENVHVLLPLDETTALIGLRGGRFFEATRNRLVERTDLAGLPSGSGTILPNGEIWLGGDGELARGTRAGGFERTRIGTADERIGAVAVRGEGDQLEALAVGIVELDNTDTATIVLFRFFGGSWSRVDQRLEGEASFRQSDIRWFDDRAVIVFGGRRGLVWDGVRLTTFTVVSPIPFFEAQLNIMALREDFGAVMAANDGFLYRLGPTPSDWTAIREALLTNSIDAVAPAYEGFLFGGPDGFVNQYYPGAVQCSTERLAGSDVERILQLGPHVLVSGGNPNRSMPNTVTWLTD